MITKEVALNNVQRLVLLLADAYDDQVGTNKRVIETLNSLVDVIDASEATISLLEARVQMLEANE